MDHIIARPSAALNGSANIISAMPSIPLGVQAGDVVFLLNRGDIPLELQDEATVPGSKLNLQTPIANLAPNAGITLMWDGSEWYEMSRASPPSDSGGEIDVTDYGAATTATGTANNVAWALAITAARAANKVLKIPDGTFKLNLHGLGGGGAAINLQAVKMRGAGKGITILKADGFVEAVYSGDTIITANDNGASLIKRTAALGEVTVSDLTLEGPNAGTITGDLNNCWGIFSAGGGTLNVERVDFDLFNQSVKCSPEYPSYPGTGTILNMVDCVNEFMGCGVLHIDGSDATKEQFNPTRVRFKYNDHGHTLIKMGPTSNGQCPCTYIYNGVSYGANDCVFDTSGAATGATAVSYGFLHFGGIGVPRYSYANNCRFYVGLQVNMQTCGTTPTTVTGCHFYTQAGYSAITAYGDVHVSNSHFNGPQAAYGITDVNGVAGSVLVENCFFGLSGATTGLVYGVSRTVDSTKPWVVNNCVFYGAYTGGSGMYVTAGVLQANRCTFDMASGVYAVRCSGGKYVSTQNRYVNKPIYLDNFVGAVTLELRENTWESGASPTEINALTAATTVNGSENTFTGTEFKLLSNTGLSTYLTGNLQAKRDVGAYAYASNIITIGRNGDFFIIDEGAAPLIKNVHNKGELGSGVVAADHNRICGTTIFLRAKQTFDVDETGNIVLVGAARTIAADEVLQLRYVPSSAKWYEIG